MHCLPVMFCVCSRSCCCRHGEIKFIYSKYVIFLTLCTSHVIWRMRSGFKCIINGNVWEMSWLITQLRIGLASSNLMWRFNTWFAMCDHCPRLRGERSKSQGQVRYPKPTNGEYLDCKRHLIVITTNRQIWVRNSKYAIIFDPLSTSHVTSDACAVDPTALSVVTYGHWPVMMTSQERIDLGALNFVHRLITWLAICYARTLSKVKRSKVKVTRSRKVSAARMV